MICVRNPWSLKAMLFGGVPVVLGWLASQEEPWDDSTKLKVVVLGLTVFSTIFAVAQAADRLEREEEKIQRLIDKWLSRPRTEQTAEEDQKIQALLKMHGYLTK